MTMTHLIVTPEGTTAPPSGGWMILISNDAMAATVG